MTSPDELVKLAADATREHHIRALREDRIETCACGKKIGPTGPDQTYRAWEEHYAEVTIAAVTAAVQAQTLRDFADWLDKTEDVPPKTCADLAREQADLIAGDPR